MASTSHPRPHTKLLCFMKFCFRMFDYLSCIKCTGTLEVSQNGEIRNNPTCNIRCPSWNYEVQNITWKLSACLQLFTTMSLNISTHKFTIITSKAHFPASHYSTERIIWANQGLLTGSGSTMAFAVSRVSQTQTRRRHKIQTHFLSNRPYCFEF